MARFTVENRWVKARWQAARLSNPGKIGIGLLVLALIIFFAAVVPQRQAFKSLKDRVKSMHAEQIETGKQVTRLDDSEALRTFYDFFPYSDSSPYWIRELDRIARVRNVKLSGSDYRLVQDKGSKLMRYEILLPVQGGYPQIRAFIADMLQAIPALALTDITIRRESTLADRLDARLTLYLYLNDY